MESNDNEKDLDLNEEISKLNMSLHESSIELWRTEEKCRLKVKSINEIDNSINQVNIENKWIEKQLHDSKSRIEEVRDTIISYDNIISCLSETLADLEVQYTKREFKMNKLKSNYEQQLFIKMELWKKEEERLNNIPEIKVLKMAELELENTKREYGELLIEKENLVKKIFKAQEESDKQRNAMIINFATVYLEMQSLNEREERSKTLLRKLNTEYNEKLNLKNSLLTSQKKKYVSPSWTHTFLYPLDSKMMNMKLDSLKNNLNFNVECFNYNPDFAYLQKLNNENSKLNNNTKKSVTFLLPSEDKVSDKNIGINLLESNIYNITNSSPIKNIEMNINADQFSKNVLIKPILNVDNKRLINKGDYNFQINKRKTTEVPSDFKFKKPCNPLQDIQKNTNIVNSGTVHASKKVTNTGEENTLTENRDEIPSMLLTSYQDKDLRQNNLLGLTEHLNFINPTSDNNIMLRDVSQYNVNSSHELNKALSGLLWNSSEQSQFESSENDSFCNADVSEFYEISGNISPYTNNVQQLNFMDFFNNPSTSTFKPNHNELNTKSHRDSGKVVFQQFKKMDSERNASTNGTLYKIFNDDGGDHDSFLPIQPSFDSEKFS